MPRLSGLEALDQLRHVLECTLPCILMSAKLDEAIVRQAEELDTASVLAKPFTLRDITGTVEQILAQCYGWQL
jgi:CheY-like chemotaxis protein